MNKCDKSRKFFISFECDFKRGDLIDLVMGLSKRIHYVGYYERESEQKIHYDIWIQSEAPISYGVFKKGLREYEDVLIESNFDHPGKVTHHFGTFKRQGRKRSRQGESPSKEELKDLISTLREEIITKQEVIDRLYAENREIRVRYDLPSRLDEMGFNLDNYDL